MARHKRDETVIEIAEFFDIHKDVVYRWVKDGCPSTRRGKFRYLSKTEVASWMKENGKTGKPGRPVSSNSRSLEDAKLRKELALAEKYELWTAREKGELVPIEDVTRGQLQRVTTVRNKLMAYGSSAATKLFGMTAVEMQRTIDDDMRQICEDFAGVNRSK